MTACPSFGASSRAPAQCRPWDTDRDCHYEDTPATWTRTRSLHGRCTRSSAAASVPEKTLPTVRHAYRTIQGLVTLAPFNARACVGRLYNRLNDDYEPLHALCRFFLEHSGPTSRAANTR